MYFYGGYKFERRDRVVLKGVGFGGRSFLWE